MISNQNIKLFWCVSNYEEANYKDELEIIAAKTPNFNFTIWASDDKGYIDANGLDISDYQNHAYLICGPEDLKKSLMKQLKMRGVKSNDIYDEEFSFR